MFFLLLGPVVIKKNKKNYYPPPLLKSNGHSLNVMQKTGMTYLVISLIWQCIFNHSKYLSRLCVLGIVFAFLPGPLFTLNIYFDIFVCFQSSADLHTGSISAFHKTLYPLNKAEH